MTKHTKRVDELLIGDEIIFEVPVRCKVESVMRQRGNASKGNNIVQLRVLDEPEDRYYPDIGSAVSVEVVRSVGGARPAPKQEEGYAT